MGRFLGIFKSFFAACAVIVACSVASQAQEQTVDELLDELANPAAENWQSLERRIRTEWSKSGSPAMDLLLQRGQKALEAEEFDVALEHLTALTDHAPDFAEGWNARATAFFRKKMYGPAMQDLSRALSLNPKHFAAMTGLAIMLQEMGFDDEALQAWRLMEEVHPHRPELKDAIEQLEKETGGQTL